MIIFLSRLIVLWLFTWGLFGNSATQAQVIGFHFKEAKKTKVKIPFRQYNNLIVVSLLVNNSRDTLNFVLDTGVSYTLITDPAVRERFGLTCLRDIKISGLGKEEALNGCVLQVDKIGIGKHIVAKKHTVIILERDVLELSAYAGVHIHGLLGYDFFSRFVVQIDYPSQRLVITNPEAFIPPKKEKNTQEIPITIEDMKPYLQAKAVTHLDTATLKLLIDTGAGHSLSLDCGTHPAIQVPTRFLSSQLGMTLNGAVDGAVARINSLEIANFHLKGVITTFPDSISLALRKNVQTVFRHGNIGCGILSRFRLIFDYTHQKLYLKPNRQYREPFEFSTSGIELTASPPYYEDIKVGGVRANSPADKVGLRRGDKIIAIDDQLVKNMKLGEVYKLLNQAAGKRISILVKLLEGTYQVVDLLLENPL
jgi:hypothetical protein